MLATALKSERKSSGDINIIIDARELIKEKTYKIGRYCGESSEKPDFAFDSGVVSRSHCELKLDTEGKLQLKDVGSTSGTYLKNEPLKKGVAYQLKNNDVVRLVANACN
ncbi:hypothetical protein [Parasitella parasitica]|uniref:FHA domain-containing protein n=1 Tax=Parasitella parasitica TaxID=35722 RepID=A0A0B7N9V2_9FUNG|nr:hypothetical protein [Parasitella parasitica]